MNRPFLYLLLVLVLVVAVSPALLRFFASDGFTSEGYAPPKGGLSQMPPSEAEGFAPPKGDLSRASSEGFAPPRVAPFALDPPRPAEPHSILVSEPIHEPFQGVSPSNKPVVAVSDTAYDAMSLKQRSDTLKDIQQIVREEIRGARTQPLLASAPLAPSAPSSPSALASPSAQQGMDYQRRCDKDQDEDQDEYRCPKNPDGSCPPVPDLSQYIRKDQIPCWGCAINY